MAPKKEPSPRGNPFAALEALRSSLPVSAPGPAPTGAGPERSKGGNPPEPVAPGVMKRKPPARAVVRMERKGRGGKEVTIVDKLGLRATELEAWCRELKQALGCGGTVDGELIVLQGDLRARVPAVLTAKGIEKVTVG